MSGSLSYINEIQEKQTDTAAIILAAGHGSRLFPITAIIPKYLIPVSFKQKLISFALKACGKSGYDIYLLVRTGNKLPQKLARQLHDMRVKILASPHYRETGGEVFNHYDFLARYKYKYLIVLPSDYYIRDFQLNDVIRQIEKDRADICIVSCPARRNGEYIELGGNGFIKKIRNEKTDFSAVGIYAITVSALASNQDLYGKSITTTGLLNTLLKRGCKARMYLYTGAWDDLGTWRRYLKGIIYFNLRLSWQRN